TDVRPISSLSSWFAAVWPRFAWGLGLFAVLAAAAWLMVPPFGEGKGRRLAKSDQRSGAEFSRQPAPSRASESPAAPAEVADQAGAQFENRRVGARGLQLEKPTGSQEKETVSRQAGQAATETDA